MATSCFKTEGEETSEEATALVHVRDASGVAVEIERGARWRASEEEE